MSWLSRCWTASCGGPAAMPYVMRSTAIAALTAMRISGVMASDLDVDDAADEHVADPHADQADDEEDDAEWQAERLGWALQHRANVGRADQEQDGGEPDRQQGDHVPAVALHGGERLDLALDPAALADRVRDRVQNRRQVAADLCLDLDGGHHELQILGGDAAHEVVERWLERHPELHLAHHALELLADRRPCLAGDELDAL